jgi:hypothetical protein
MFMTRLFAQCVFTVAVRQAITTEAAAHCRKPLLGEQTCEVVTHVYCNQNTLRAHRRQLDALCQRSDVRMHTVGMWR